MGHPIGDLDQILGAFANERPTFWRELKSPDPEQLIAMIVKKKGRQYLEDRRVVIVCWILDEKVHIEWCSEEDYPEICRRYAFMRTSRFDHRQ